MEAYANWIGSVGVSLLLLAFFLNTFKQIDRDSRIYIGLNVLGAGIACFASYLIGFLPFVVLEGVWCLVAAVALFRPRSRS